MQIKNHSEGKKHPLKSAVVVVKQTISGSVRKKNA